MIPPRRRLKKQLSARRAHRARPTKIYKLKISVRAVGTTAPTQLQLATMREGVAEGDGVDKFEAGAGGDAGGETGDSSAETG